MRLVVDSLEYEIVSLYYPSHILAIKPACTVMLEYTNPAMSISG